MSARNPVTANIVKFKSLDAATQATLKLAVTSRQRAYCPYSKFQVGAAVLCQNGTTYGGCNVENSAYTVGICAERTALSKAISEGAPSNSFTAVAVIGDQKECYTTPCGACRQFISEFGNLKVYCSKPELEDVFVTDVKELLPYQFEFEVGKK